MVCAVPLTKALAEIAKMGLLAGSCQPHLLDLDGTHGCALRGALPYGIQPAISALLLRLCCVQVTQIPIGGAVAGPPWPPYDLIILDEAQDVNPVTLDVRARACQAGGSATSSNAVVPGTVCRASRVGRGCQPQANWRCHGMTLLPACLLTPATCASMHAAAAAPARHQDHAGRQLPGHLPLQQLLQRHAAVRLLHQIACHPPNCTAWHGLGA